MRRTPTSLTLLSLVAATSLLTVSSAASDPDSQENWPSWRGPAFSGASPKGQPPTEWSETKNIRWKVELPGTGHSTPAVWGDRVYVMTAIAMGAEPAPPTPPPSEPGAPPARGPRLKPTVKYHFAVLALDRGTGKTLWKTVVREEVPHESGHSTSSQVSSSPITDGERIYAFFGSRGLYALDAAGKVVWQKDFGAMKTRNEFGEGASPALHGDTLVVNWDHEGDDFIAAFDTKTGSERWRVTRDEETTWSTPLVVEDEGRALVIVSATKLTRAYDLKTGAEVWRCSGLGANAIPTPVADRETVFVMSGYQEPAGLAIRYTGAKGDLTGSPAVAWKIDRGTSYVPSPLLLGGKLYFVERFRAVLSRYDLKTGQQHYTEQRIEGLENIYASPVGANGYIYLVDRTGSAAVLKHADTFEVIARNKLDDAFDASPAIAGNEIFLRGHKNLYCIAGG